MPFSLTMPKLSPTMEEGTLAKWHKKEGDRVEPGDLLLEVATDKATVEYNALDGGILRKILVKEGALAQINQPIAIFAETKEESIEEFIPKAPVAEKKEQIFPETTAPLQTEKISPRFSMESPAFAPEPPLSSYTFPFTEGRGEKVKASPLARKMAKEKNVDLSSVKGSGPGGRVTSHDLSMAQPASPVGFGRRQVPKTLPGTFQEMPLTPLRKVISQRLQQAKTYIPHIYVTMLVNAERLTDVREELKEAGIKVSVNDLIVRATALALKEHPHCNSGFNSVTQSIVLFETIDIAVAVSVEGGLITPIVRYADYKSVGEISVEIKELATRARAGKLAPEEYKGGSFTISNLGMYGVQEFCAIINPPQAAILAVGGIEEVVCVKKGAIGIGKRMHLTLSADHRVIDGAEAAQFLGAIKKYLESPSLIIA